MIKDANLNDSLHRKHLTISGAVSIAMFLLALFSVVVISAKYQQRFDDFVLNVQESRERNENRIGALESEIRILEVTNAKIETDLKYIRLRLDEIAELIRDAN